MIHIPLIYFGEQISSLKMHDDTFLQNICYISIIYLYKRYAYFKRACGSCKNVEL